MVITNLNARRWLQSRCKRRCVWSVCHQPCHGQISHEGYPINCGHGPSARNIRGLSTQPCRTPNCMSNVLRSQALLRTLLVLLDDPINQCSDAVWQARFGAQVVNQKNIYKSPYFRRRKNCRANEKMLTRFPCPVRVPANLPIPCHDKRLRPYYPTAALPVEM